MPNFYKKRYLTYNKKIFKKKQRNKYTKNINYGLRKRTSRNTGRIIKNYLGIRKYNRKLRVYKPRGPRGHYNTLYNRVRGWGKTTYARQKYLKVRQRFYDQGKKFESKRKAFKEAKAMELGRHNYKYTPMNRLELLAYTQKNLRKLGLPYRLQ